MMINLDHPTSFLGVFRRDRPSPLQFVDEGPLVVGRTREPMDQVGGGLSREGKRARKSGREGAETREFFLHTRKSREWKGP